MSAMAESTDVLAGGVLTVANGDGPKDACRQKGTRVSECLR